MAYTGTVAPLPVGIQGFSGSRNPSQIQSGHLEYADGVVLDGGVLQKEGGASKVNSSAIASGAKILSGINYSPLSDVHRDAIFTSAGTILKDSGAGTWGTTMASGLNVSTAPPPHFCMAGGESVGAPRTLFMFSEHNQVRAVDADGNTMSVITSPAADWTGAGNFPTFGILHEGRLWGGGNASDPHRMYYSSLGDHQNFTTSGAGTLAIFPGESVRIVGAASFKGLLIIFKYPQGVYAISTSDPSPSGWRVEKITGSVGAVNQHTILPVENDVMYLTAAGNVNLLSATNAFGDAETASISKIADINEFIRSFIDTSILKKACGVWYPYKNQAWFGLTRLGSTDNDIRLMVDISVSPPRFLLSRRDITVSMWLRPDTAVSVKPVHGDASGFIWAMDTDSRNKGGAGYPVSFQSANMDLGFIDPKLATVNKTGDFLELVFEPQGDWDLQIQISWDDTPMPPLLFSMGGLGAPLGTFILDTDVLASTAVRSIRRRIVGSGRRIRISGDNSEIDQNIAIANFYLSFRTTDERQV